MFTLETSQAKNMASLTEMGFKSENHTATPIVLIRAKESCTHTTISSPSFEQFEAALIKQSFLMFRKPSNAHSV